MTATGDIALDFTGLSDVSPYTPPELEALSGSARIVGETFRAVSGTVYMVTPGVPSADIIETSIEIGTTGTGKNDSSFALLMNSSGEWF